MTHSVSEDVTKRAAAIALLILDVDGVLTDGRIILDDRGKETKHFHVRDGHGIKLLLRSGIEVLFLTGRTSRVVAHRAQDLGVKEVYQGVHDKVKVFQEIIGRKKISPDRIAFVGDDIVDVPLFKKVGLAVAVQDACDDARRAAHYVTVKDGGKGAVREVCELLLRSQGKWADIAVRYGLDE